MKRTSIFIIVFAILTTCISPYAFATDTPYTEQEATESTLGSSDIVSESSELSETQQSSEATNTEATETQQEGEASVLSLDSSSYGWANIHPGIYRIKNVYSSMYIDINDTGASYGDLVYQNSFSEHQSELWYIEPYLLDDEYYIIRSVQNSCFLGTLNPYVGTSNVFLNTIADPDGIGHTDSTLWKIYKNSSNQMVIYPKISYMAVNCLSVPSNISGAYLQQTDYAGNDMQHWILEQYDGVEDGIVHTVKNVTNGKYAYQEMDLPYYNIELSSFSRSKLSLLWKFEYNGEGYYKIKNDYTGFYWYLGTGSTDGASIIQSSYSSYVSDEFESQFLWRIIKQTDGSYKIQNKNQIGTSIYACVFNNMLVVKSNVDSSNWVLRPLKLNVTVFYDQAFVDRFGSSYATVMNNIYGENSRGLSFASVFKDRYGIDVNVTFTNTIHSSNPYAQNCNHKNAINTYCYDCKGESTIGNEEDESYKKLEDCKDYLHHKRELAFYNTIQNQAMIYSTYINTLITGHVGCTNYNILNAEGQKQEVHREGVSLGKGLQSKNHNIIFASMFSNDFSDNYYDDVIGVVVHEILHNMEIIHCDENDSCIMYKSVNAAYEEIELCYECHYKVITNKLLLFNH